MKLHFLLFLIAFYFELSGTFFLLEAKSIYFCLKVCPLYCSKREKRGVGPPPYWDADDYIPYHKSSPYIYDDDDVPYHHYHPRFIYCKPHPTTAKPTTTPTTTTTDSPSGICEFCNKKCGFPSHTK